MVFFFYIIVFTRRRPARWHPSILVINARKQVSTTWPNSCKLFDPCMRRCDTLCVPLVHTETYDVWLSYTVGHEWCNWYSCITTSSVSRPSHSQHTLFTPIRKYFRVRIPVLKIKTICHTQLCEKWLGLVKSCVYLTYKTRKIYQILPYAVYFAE